uniref:Cytochrome P450 CYP307A1 n=2 Tax=Laodelphax striatellus TaxID=195883 RepID=M9T1D7_LAOST|nr:cytochrome P450 CYP307A1 [Laodelphax striatellus]
MESNSALLLRELLTASACSYTLLAALLLVLVMGARDALLTPCSRRAPGPRAWPVLGSLHLMAGYRVPYEAFTALAHRYGAVFGMRLGSVQCLVVNGLDNIREVLISKNNHFDGRPDFTRYKQLFAGDKDNSLAFCNWSDLQKARRDMLQAHTFPRPFTSRYNQLDEILSEEWNHLYMQLKSAGNDSLALKPLIVQGCANIFTSYFCSKRFDNDNVEFLRMVRNFDEVFYEVNQGYAADFIPWLMPLLGKHLKRISGWSHEIREFMEKAIMKERLETLNNNMDMDASSGDYVDSLIEHIHYHKQPTITWETAMFALEDIIGGHSAVANLLVKVLAFIVQRADIQQRAFDEAEAATGGRDVTLADRTHMPYTEAIILEAIRLIASPIVPHVANQDSVIAGYTVEKDTLIFLNNYSLSMDPALWDEPEKFKPERFISPEGHIVKPDHFLPFGGGRRSCMGYKMVQLIGFSILGSILHRFHLSPVEGVDYQVPIGNLALPYDTFNFKLEHRL